MVVSSTGALSLLNSSTLTNNGTLTHTPTNGGNSFANYALNNNGTFTINADPSNERSYELSIVLRRKPPAEVPRTMKAPPAPSPVAGRFFGKKR